MTHPVEKLRRIWTPQREVEEMLANLDPGSNLDSQIRDLFHRVIHQKGSVTLDLEALNTGTLRWEVIRFESSPGMITGRQIVIWVEP